MRQVYLDESGISANESITVVAGVIIDPDKQWKLVAEYLNSLLLEYIPAEHHPGFAFHAKELFHGSKRFDPSHYLPERRRELLRKLVEIPARFHLPTFTGTAIRCRFRTGFSRTGQRNNSETCGQFITR